MLIGMPKQKSTTTQATNAFVFDVGAANFEDKVLKASMTTPILIDFWAPWCGPCLQLTPVLEQLVSDTKGAVLLAKVNVDENPELSQAFRIQSLPTVLALFGGQPVTGFMGVQPTTQIKAIIDQLVKAAKATQPEALDIPATLKQAHAFLASGQLGEAQNLYAMILEQVPDEASAYAGMIRSFIAAGDIEQAVALLNAAPESIVQDPQFASAKTAVALAQNAPQGDVNALVQKLHQNPSDHACAFELAEIYFARGRQEEALELLLGIMKRNRMWEDEKAKKQILVYFEALGVSDPLTIKMRKKLSAILFS